MDSNLAKGSRFLRVMNICSTPSFRGEVKPSAPCSKILKHVKKKLLNYERDTLYGKLYYFLHQFLLLCY
jgi:hypothetical protein